jgi:hypothetical protein
VRESKKWGVKESRDLKIQQNVYLTTPQRRCRPLNPIPTLLNPISSRLKIYKKTCRRIPNVSPFLGTRWGYDDTLFDWPFRAFPRREKRQGKAHVVVSPMCPHFWGYVGDTTTRFLNGLSKGCGWGWRGRKWDSRACTSLLESSGNCFAEFLGLCSLLHPTSCSPAPIVSSYPHCVPK